MLGLFPKTFPKELDNLKNVANIPEELNIMEWSRGVPPA